MRWWCQRHQARVEDAGKVRAALSSCSTGCWDGSARSRRKPAPRRPRGRRPGLHRPLEAAADARPSSLCAWVCAWWAVPLWFHPSQVMGVSRLTLLISNECLRASPATEHSGPSRARAPSTSNTDQRATHYGEQHWWKGGFRFSPTCTGKRMTNSALSLCSVCSQALISETLNAKHIIPAASTWPTLFSCRRVSGASWATRAPSSCPGLGSTPGGQTTMSQLLLQAGISASILRASQVWTDVKPPCTEWVLLLDVFAGLRWKDKGRDKRSKEHRVGPFLEKDLTKSRWV